MEHATDGILSLTAMNVMDPCRLIQSFTIAGVEGFLIFTVVISLKVIAKTSHEAQSVLNSGLASALSPVQRVALTQDGIQRPGL